MRRDGAWVLGLPQASLSRLPTSPHIDKACLAPGDREFEAPCVSYLLWSTVNRERVVYILFLLISIFQFSYVNSRLLVQ